MPYNINYDTWEYKNRHFTTKELIAIFDFKIDDLTRYALPSTKTLLTLMR